MSYELINPFIKGSVSRTFSGKTPLDAANNAWSSISEHITGNVPRFGFTLDNSGSLHHFVVKESRKGSVVDFSIEELKLSMPSKLKNKFMGEVNRLRNEEQSGGKKEKAEKADDDSSDSDEVYKKMKKHLKQVNDTQPVLYWWYSPFYTVLDIDYYMPTVFVPRFIRPYYVELQTFSSAFFV